MTTITLPDADWTAVAAAAEDAAQRDALAAQYADRADDFYRERAGAQHLLSVARTIRAAVEATP